MPIFGECVPGIEYQARSAAYAVILREDTVAAIRNRYGRYFLPGGGANAGETPEDTVLREIREELGCEGKLVHRLGEAEQFFFAASEDKHYHMHAVFYLAELPDEAEAFPQSDEEQLAWLPVQEAETHFFHACHAWAVGLALGLRACHGLI